MKSLPNVLSFLCQPDFSNDTDLPLSLVQLPSPEAGSCEASASPGLHWRVFQGECNEFNSGTCQLEVGLLKLYL